MGLTAVSGLVFMICQAIWLHRNGMQGVSYVRMREKERVDREMRDEKQRVER
jgi:hypothetical protein